MVRESVACPECRGPVYSEGRLAWCSYEYCNYGLLEDVTAEEHRNLSTGCGNCECGGRP